MKNGNWIPLDKCLARRLLPTKDRAYSRAEAALSLQLDYDAGKPATVAGYASCWGWSRGKVARFLKELGVKIEYGEPTDRKQNQNGQIMIQIADRSRTDNEQIRIIDSRHLESKTDRSRTDNGQITDRSWSTTSNPNPDPDPKNTPLTPHGGAPSQALKEGQHEGTDAGSAAPIPFAEIIAYLNDKTGKQFKASTRETQRHIRARWGEGFRLHDFKRVVDNKASAWSSDPKMADYLRPQTLFGTKFEAYLNEGKTKRREVPIGGQFQKHDE